MNLVKLDLKTVKLFPRYLELSINKIWDKLYHVHFCKSYLTQKKLNSALNVLNFGPKSN